MIVESTISRDLRHVFTANKLNFYFFDLKPSPEYESGMNKWHVYLLRCSDNSLYCGVTIDPLRRLQEHNSGGRKSAKYTRARLPVTIEAIEELPDKRSAYQLEYAVKKQSALQKITFLKTTAQEMRNQLSAAEVSSISERY